MIRKIAANLIFPMTSEPVKNGHLIIGDDNSIIKLVNTQGKLNEIAGLEYYSGILVPGLILSDNDSSKDPVLLDQLQNDCNDMNRKNARYLWSRGIEAVNAGFDFDKFKSWDILDIGNDFYKWLEQLTIENSKKLNIERLLGCFEPGKKSGVLLITGYNFDKGNLGANAKVLRLV